MSTKKDTKFNPNEHIENIKGKPYLPVQWRLVWFREERPDWGIHTKIEKEFEDGAIMKASILNELQVVVATAHKMETKTGFKDYLEKAETGAVGRALAMVGYGTQFSPDLEEGDRLADAPVKTNYASATPPAKIDKKATKPQKGMFFAIAEVKGYDGDTAKKMAKKKFNLESFNDITGKQVNEAIDGLNKLDDAPAKEDVDPKEIPDFDGEVE